MFVVQRALARCAHKSFAIALTALAGLSVSPVASADKYPVISGTPKTAATVGQYYSFKASAHDPDGKRIIFAVKNKPAWAQFNGTTGELKGTPNQAGRWPNIIISAWDGRLTKALPAFTITATQARGTSRNQPPTISGRPANSATAGVAYNFTPTARDPEGRALGFTIQNRPAWASFNTSTGRLSGTPNTSHVRTYPNIRITVSDGHSTTSLPAFSIAVRAPSTTTPPPAANGAATLSWTPPTRNTDGSTLTNLSGYRIYYGTNASALTRTVNVNSAGLASYVVTDLSPATYYFAITAFNASGAESARSRVVSKVVR